jgi:hypothetical protein
VLFYIKAANLLEVKLLEMKTIAKMFPAQPNNLILNLNGYKKNKKPSFKSKSSQIIEFMKVSILISTNKDQLLLEQCTEMKENNKVYFPKGFDNKKN